MIMTNEDRKIFYETLCSLDGKDYKKDLEKLKSTIKYPKLLFRYRAVNKNTLTSLEDNKLYFSTANYYDDPFDTFLGLDIKKIKEDVNLYLEDKSKIEKSIKETMDLLSKEITLTDNINLDEINLEKILEIISQGGKEYFFQIIPKLRNKMKEKIWSSCFSENGFNEVLWLKYANQHRGFSLIYDLDEINEKLFCGKSEACNNCGIKQYGFDFFPIYYSDEKYDATKYAKYFLTKEFENKAPNLKVWETLYNNLGNLDWEREKITLIKKKCHEYDEEWRVLIKCEMKGPVSIKWIPSGLILGLNMKNDDIIEVIKNAKKAGIDKIYFSFINDEGNLDGTLLSNETIEKIIKGDN